MANKILVALDNSAINRSVFDEALMMAKTTESHLRVLHIIPLDKETIRDAPGHLTDLNPFLFDQREDSSHEEHLFKKYVSEAIHARIRAEFFQYFGDPGQIICNFASVWEADLIVVGRRGHSSLDELLLGSVSNYVVHHAPCSVHVVYHPGRAQSQTMYGSQIRAIY